MTRKTTSSTRTLLATCTLFLGSVLLALAISEVVLRLVTKNPSVYYRRVSGDEPYQPDPNLGWRLTPNARMRIYSPEYDFRAAVNSRGIRGPEIPASGPDECRILIIGDSFAAGFTVDYKATSGQVLQKLLEQSGNRHCKVVSAGVDGYSTDQELLLFQKMAPELAPTLTILFFYFNDVYCNISTTCFGYNKPVFQMTNGDQLSLTNTPVPENRNEYKKTGVVTIKETEPANYSLRQWMQAHSHLYRLLRREVQIALGQQDRIPLRSAMFITPLPELFRVFSHPYDETTEKAWRITEKLIMQMDVTARNNGSDFMVFHVPMRGTIHQQEWDRALQAHNLDINNWNSSLVEMKLGEICKKNRMKCILPAERFRLLTEREPGNRRYYLSNDPHWNEAGHILVAEKIKASAVYRALIF